MSTELILKILQIVVIPIILVILTYKLNKKLNKDREESKKDLNQKLSILNDRMQVIESISTRTEKLLNQHLLDDEFKHKYNSTIRIVLERNIDTPLLAQRYKNILSYFGDALLDFVFAYYYYFEKRSQTIRDREKYVNREKRTMLDDFHSYLYNTMDSIKLYNQKKVNFVSFLDELNIYNSIELLALRLVKNGFDKMEGKEELNEVLANTLDKFCEQFINATTIWDTLPIPEKEITYD